MAILTQDEILELYHAAIAAGLTQPGMPDALLGGIDPSVTGLSTPNLPPNVRLLNDLNLLNKVERLVDGTIPLKMWLTTAAAISPATEKSRIFGRMLAEADRRMSRVPRLPDLATLHEYKERIIHRDDMLPYGFLTGAITAGKSVAKLTVPRYDNGRQSGSIAFLGTGWLITRDLMMTNYHVIRNAGRASRRPVKSISSCRHRAREPDSSLMQKAYKAMRSPSKL